MFKSAVLNDQKLSYGERIYYSLVVDRAGYECQGFSMQNHETFADLGFSVESSKEMVKSLKKKGYIKSIGQRREYIMYEPLVFYT